MTISKRGRWLSQLFLMLSLLATPVFAAPESEPLPEGTGPSVDATPATLSPAALPSSVDQTAEAMPADAAAAQRSDEPEQPLAIQIESLKKQLIKLNRDLFILEEELLFPANTQLSVLLAFDADDTFSLDSVKLKIDDEVVTQYLYTDRQIHALQRGGVQRLYMGNLRAGEHELTAVFIGFGPNKREYKRAATLTFNKETGQKTIEVKISASEGSYQPEFSVIES